MTELIKRNLPTNDNINKRKEETPPDINQTIKPFVSKTKNKVGNICYCLLDLEKYGTLNVIYLQDSQKLFISKSILVQFEDHFDELFERGRKLCNSRLLKLYDTPDITFWYQRYYYYNKFDEGIIMDNESK